MKRNITYLILLVGFTCAQAAPAYSFDAQPKQVAIQSQCIMTTGAAYSSTVYEPFDNSTPSSYSETEATGGNHPLRTRRSGGDDGWDDSGFILGPDTPPGNESPVGDPWIMLLFASALAAVLAWRKRNKKA